MSLRLLERLTTFLADAQGELGVEVAVALTGRLPPAPINATLLVSAATALPVLIRGDFGRLPKLDIRRIGAGKPKLPELSCLLCSRVDGRDTGRGESLSLCLSRLALLLERIFAAACSKKVPRLVALSFSPASALVLSDILWKRPTKSLSLTRRVPHVAALDRVSISRLHCSYLYMASFEVVG